MTIVFINNKKYDLSKILQRPKVILSDHDFVKLLLALLLFKYFITCIVIKNKNSFLFLYYICIFLYLFSFLKVFD